MKNKFFRHAGLDPVSSGFMQLDSGLRRNDKAGLRFTINKQHFSILEAVMNACLTTTGLMQRFHRLFGVLVLSLFSFLVMAAEAPVVSVDHRVTASFSKPQFDPRKGVYTSEVRIKNRSAVSLLPPLRLTLETFDGKDVKPLNALGVGKDERPYFEFTLPKGMLDAGGVTDPVRVVFSIDMNKDIGVAKERVVVKTQTPTSLAYHVSAGVELAPLEPRAEPYALTVDSGKVNVRFSVRLVGKVKSSTTVYLRRSGEVKSIAMNDQGKDGDLVAKDGIYGVNMLVDGSRVKVDTCLSYEAFMNVGRAEVNSAPFQLCMSAFPVRAAASNTSKPALLTDGTKAVADEILIATVPNTISDDISQIAAEINAKVVGSIPPLNLYQLKLSGPVSSERLLELVVQVKKRTEVKAVTVNAIGTYLSSDFYYGSQHGLQLIRAQDIWGAGAVGSGVTVTVLDSGIDRTHPDFGTVGDCQLAENDCGGVITDALGHGTQVAGIIAAKTDNSIGVAGIAYRSKIHSIQVSADAAITDVEMAQGFTNSAAYGLATVINASFGVLNAFGNWAPVCTAINSAVLNGVTPVAVVVNGAGNNNTNGAFYPAKCNDSTVPASAGLTRKDLLITVANSASVIAAVDPICGAAAVDQRCSDSNYGAWVDMAAPGSAIWTTTLGGGYTNPSGSSFSTPMVSGAAAILKSCGVPLDQIEPTLKTSSNVNVAYPANGTNPAGTFPRLDIYRALMQRNRVPTGVGITNTNLNEHINTAGGYDVGTLSAVDADTCDKFTFSIVGGADAASFSVNAATNTLRINAGLLNYVTKSSYAVTVRVTDFWGAAFDQPLTVNVINVNDPPTAVNLSNIVPSTPENGGSIKVADIAVVDDGMGTNVLSLSGPDAAAFNIASSALYFTGGANFEVKNNYSVTVNVDDASVGAVPDATQNFSLAITNVNEAPVANNDTLGANQNTPVTYAAALLLGNDTDVDAGTTLAVASVTSGVGGTVVLNGVGTVTFTPTTGFSGAASFTYRATDGSLQSNVATVTVNVAPAVNHAPVAVGDTLAANEDVPVIYSAAQLLGNDTDADAGTVLSIASVTNGAGGNVVLNGDGTVTFSPAPNFNGVANFTYTTTDGSLSSNIATVTVNVAAMNDLPNGKPAITGTRTNGQTLTADPSAITDADGLGTFGYQWKRDGANVGTNSSTYLLGQADIGGFMSLCVFYTDGGGTLETVCNDADSVAVGDPHITTVDGLIYDFQSAGEFVSLRGDEGMEIQVRQTPVPTASALRDWYSGITAGVSINTGVAARVGKHRVTFQQNISGNPASSGMELRVDGVVTALPADGLDLGLGGRVVASPGGGIQVDFPDQTTLIVTPGWWAPHNVWYLNVNVFHTTAHEGLMGARKNGSWLPALSNGAAVGAMPAAVHDRYVELYVKFADSWRVNDKTSLFDYAKDSSTRTFTFREWPRENGPYVLGDRKLVKPIERNIAQRACGGVARKKDNADCVFDVMVTGNTGIAETHLLTQKILVGSTAIIVRDDRFVSDDKEMVTFTASVKRNSSIPLREFGIKGVPTGTVQFMVNGERVADPVKLDERGQAVWKVSRQKVNKQTISVRYIPAKGSIFLPSSDIVGAGSVTVRK